MTQALTGQQKVNLSQLVKKKSAWMIQSLTICQLIFVKTNVYRDLLILCNKHKTIQLKRQLKRTDILLYT